MALTASYMLPLETTAPDFKLMDTLTQKEQTRDVLFGKAGTVVIFMCNHCPYVIHLMDAIVAFSNAIKPLGVATVGISSNSVVSHPQDGPEAMKSLAIEKGFKFPYLFDETQTVAHAYQAACTPDFYLFDKNMQLYYRGRFDTSRPKNGIPITGEDLRNAVNQMVAEKPYEGLQYPSMGCNIKWIPGNEPKE